MRIVLVGMYDGLTFPSETLSGTLDPDDMFLRPYYFLIANDGVVKGCKEAGRIEWVESNGLERVLGAVPTRESKVYDGMDVSELAKGLYLVRSNGAGSNSEGWVDPREII